MFKLFFPLRFNNRYHMLHPCTWNGGNQFVFILILTLFLTFLWLVHFRSKKRQKRVNGSVVFWTSIAGYCSVLCAHHSKRTSNGMAISWLFPIAKSRFFLAKEIITRYSQYAHQEQNTVITTCSLAATSKLCNDKH